MIRTMPGGWFEGAGKSDRLTLSHNERPEYYRQSDVLYLSSRVSNTAPGEPLSDGSGVFNKC